MDNDTKDMDNVDKPKPKVDVMNPRIGIPAVLLSNLCLALSRLCIKYIFTGHPDIGFSQLLLYRAILSFAFNIIWLNKNLKVEMYDSVKRELIGQLILKGIHGNL